MERKSYQIAHGYFKKGDDFKDALDSNNNKVVPALRDWAESLMAYAYDLKKMADLLETQKDIQGDGGTHHAAIYNVPEEIGLKLEEMKIAFKDDFEEDEDEEFEIKSETDI